MIPFGKYLLLERIAVGGMAEVFLAKTFGVAGFEKMIALKRILPGARVTELKRKVERLRDRSARPLLAV